MLKYASWTNLQRVQPPLRKFPRWDAVGDGTWLSGPTVANMETYADARYKEVCLVRANGLDSPRGIHE